MSDIRTALSKIGLVDPYEDLDVSPYSVDLQGWGHESPIFEEVFSQRKPRSVIEVGTWNGASAIRMAQLLKKHSHEGVILCIDTWLGSSRVLWTDEHRHHLRLEHGFPTQYFQFLANVVLEGHRDVILPLPMESTQAALFLREEEVEADVIYIDGSHREEGVYRDLASYWPLLRPDGVIFGDDYSVSFPGVIRSVNRFIGGSLNLGLYLPKRHFSL